MGAHLDQRAWVGNTEVLPPIFADGNKAVYLKDGQETSFTTFIMNSGKTPAKNVTQSYSYRTLSSGVAFSLRYPGTDRMGVIQPGLRLQVTTPTTERASKVQIDTYRTGENVLYLYGRITYDDVFDKPHSTTFCMRLLRDLTAFTDCDTYNDAN